jgi:hypothetical protein
MADIFLSYASEDRELIKPLVEVLETQGFSVWWDRAIASGSRWDDVIQRELEASSAVVVVWTHNSVASDWVRTECMEALGRDILFPVRLDSASVPLAFRRTQAANLEGWVADEENAELNHFVKGLRQFLAGVSESAPSPEPEQKPVPSSVQAPAVHGPTFHPRAFPAPAIHPRAFPAPAGTRQRGSRRLVLGVSLILILIAAGLGGWFVDDLLDSDESVSVRSWDSGSAVVRSIIELHPDAPLVVGGSPPLVGYYSTSLALPPDGRYLAYVGETADGIKQLYLRDLSQFEFELVTDSAGAAFAFFSPDSRWLGFLTDDRLKKVAVTGGSPITIANAEAAPFAAWLSDQEIHVASNLAWDLSRVDLSLDQSVAVNGIEEVMTRSTITDVLPGGVQFLRSTLSARSWSHDHGELTLLKLPDLEQSSLGLQGYGGRYLPTGHLLFGRNGDLYAAPFDLHSGVKTGNAVRVVEDVAMEALFGYVQATTSASGLLAYAHGGDFAIGRIYWVDRDGNTEALPIAAAAYNYFDLSPDDGKLALHVTDVEDYVLIHDFDTGAGRKLVADGAAGWPIWSPDGDRLLISRQVAEAFALGSTAVDASGTFEEMVRYDARTATFTFWTKQGAQLFGVWEQGMSSASAATGTIETIVDEGKAWGAEASPDGRWIVYSSYITGKAEVRVRSFPDGGIDRQLSQGGGMEPVWCRDCEEVFYRKGNRWYSSPVDLEAKFPIVGPPRLVFEAPGFVDTAGRSYDVSRDGQRMLIMRAVNPPDRTRLHLVHNWFSELEQLAPR